MKLYSYIPDKDLIREQATMKEPAILDELQFENITNEGRIAYLKYRNDYKEHIASLQTFPVIGKPDWPDTVEEGVHFKTKAFCCIRDYDWSICERQCDNNARIVAIPIEDEGDCNANSQYREQEEENKWIWSDELALEFAKQYRFSSSRISLEMFKDSKGFKVEQLKGVEQQEEENAIEFAEWLELSGYRIKGMDDAQRSMIYLQFKSQTKINPLNNK